MSFDPFNPFTQPPRNQQGRGNTQQQRRTAGIRQPLDEKEMQREKKQGEKKKRNKVLRYMFNPEFGSSFEGLRESHGTFMRLIANVFLQTGLIDATYPGLRDPRQLKLHTLLKTGYDNLQYTREGMPRVLLFYTFVSSLAMIVLAILIFIVSIATASQPQPTTPQVPPETLVRKAAPLPASAPPERTGR